jgi:hypothetical protein
MWRHRIIFAVATFTLLSDGCLAQPAEPNAAVTPPHQLAVGTKEGVLVANQNAHVPMMQTAEGGPRIDASDRLNRAALPPHRSAARTFRVNAQIASATQPMVATTLATGQADWPR